MRPLIALRWGRVTGALAAVGVAAALLLARPAPTEVLGQTAPSVGTVLSLTVAPGAEVSAGDVTVSNQTGASLTVQRTGAQIRLAIPSGPQLSVAGARCQLLSVAGNDQLCSVTPNGRVVVSASSAAPPAVDAAPVAPPASAVAPATGGQPSAPGSAVAPPVSAPSGATNPPAVALAAAPPATAPGTSQPAAATGATQGSVAPSGADTGSVPPAGAPAPANAASGGATTPGGADSPGTTPAAAPANPAARAGAPVAPAAPSGVARPVRITQLPTALPKTGTGVDADTPFGPPAYIAALCAVAGIALVSLVIARRRR